MNTAAVETKKQTSCDVLIQGAGIGGLTLGIALQRLGYTIAIVERARGLSEAGAGIWMAANPMQVFDKLGFAHKIAAAGWPIRLLRLRDSKSGDIHVTDLSAAAVQFGFETIALHRRALQSLLHDQLRPGTVRFGCEIQSMEQNNERVIATLSDGSDLSSSIVAGADGFHSEVRRMIGLGGEKRYTGTSSYRAVTRDLSILPAGAEHEAHEIWAKGCRLGFSRINADEMYWYMTFDAPVGATNSAEDRKRHAEAITRTHFPQGIGMVESTQAEDILRTDLSDLKPLTRWSAGRIGLVGDAAHATTPNSGQGGAMAVEDALVLAESFQKFGLNHEAWRRFEQARRKKVDWTVSTSWFIGKISHAGNPLLRALRNTLLRKTPASMTQKQLARMYTLDRLS